MGATADSHHLRRKQQAQVTLKSGNQGNKYHALTLYLPPVSVILPVNQIPLDTRETGSLLL